MSDSMEPLFKIPNKEISINELKEFRSTINKCVDLYIHNANNGIPQDDDILTGLNILFNLYNTVSAFYFHYDYLDDFPDNGSAYCSDQDSGSSIHSDDLDGSLDSAS